MRLFKQHKIIDFGDYCQPSPSAVELTDRIDILHDTLTTVVTVILVFEMVDANLVSNFYIHRVCRFYALNQFSKRSKNNSLVRGFIIS